MTQHHKVFQVDHHEDIAVITLQPANSGYRYADVHKESNVVLHLFDQPAHNHVVVDLSQVDIMSSSMIGVFVRLFRKISNAGGCAAFCSASENMTRIVQDMNLTQIWSIFPTREAAIEAIQNKITN
ncbi:MAG: hypothetical protein CMJ78_05755 [Planctomycetaceae bacterium]|nr:hypothetical protein [Planctomycetaceae bacterium]